MESTNNWASFYHESLDLFSEDFRDEMAKQLERNFNLFIGVEDFAQKNKFQLLVGITPLQTIYQNGYGFCVVDIVDRYSSAVSVTAYWKSKDGDSERATNSSQLDTNDLEFGWCADFDKERFLNFELAKTITEVQNKALGFKYSAAFDLYPDLSYTFTFKSTPNEDDLRNLSELLHQSFSASYVSDISLVEKSYRVMIDFQSTPIEKGIGQIDEFMRGFISLELKNNTESVSIN